VEERKFLLEQEEQLEQVCRDRGRKGGSKGWRQGGKIYCLSQSVYMPKYVSAYFGVFRRISA
jgi:hypothetical protein